MRGISWRNLNRHFTLIDDIVSERDKYIAVNDNEDKFYLVDGFGYNLRVIKKLSIQEVNNLVDEVQDVNE